MEFPTLKRLNSRPVHFSSYFYFVFNVYNSWIRIICVRIHSTTNTIRFLQNHKCKFMIHNVPMSIRHSVCAKSTVSQYWDFAYKVKASLDVFVIIFWFQTLSAIVSSIHYSLMVDFSLYLLCARTIGVWWHLLHSTYNKFHFLFQTNVKFTLDCIFTKRNFCFIKKAYEVVFNMGTIKFFYPRVIIREYNFLYIRKVYTEFFVKLKAHQYSAE